MEVSAFASASLATLTAWLRPLIEMLTVLVPDEVPVVEVPVDEVPDVGEVVPDVGEVVPVAVVLVDCSRRNPCNCALTFCHF